MSNRTAPLSLWTIAQTFLNTLFALFVRGVLFVLTRPEITLKPQQSRNIAAKRSR
ncbi:MAG: hypothetical protein HY054_06385 [Proteobacteria bacterium]|nr:hypothetical protein [Pseudomonadota bacterium]